MLSICEDTFHKTAVAVRRFDVPPVGLIYQVSDVKGNTVELIADSRITMLGVVSE